jgi:hypothetical protein
VSAHSVQKFGSVDIMPPNFDIVAMRTYSQLVYPLAAGGTEVKLQKQFFTGLTLD